VFDLSIPTLLVLAVIALVIFGPNELPQIASQIGRAQSHATTLTLTSGPAA